MTYSKTLLATILASATFVAQAELKPLGDEALADITGQAGIRLGLGLDLNIGALEYIDTDEGGGTLSLQGIEINSNQFQTDENGNFTDINDEIIDLTDLQDNFDEIYDRLVVVANPDGSGPLRGATDITVDIDVVGDQLVFTTAPIFDLDVLVDDIVISSNTENPASSSIGGIGILNVRSPGSTLEISGGGADVEGNDSGLTISTTLNSRFDFVYFDDADVRADILDESSDRSGTLSLEGVTFSGDAENGGIEVNNLTIDVVDDQLQIALPQITGTIAVDSVNIGDTSIGSLAIRNLNLAGTTISISGK